MIGFVCSNPGAANLLMYSIKWLMSLIYRLPGVAISILLMVGEKMPDTIDSAFFFGPAQVKEFISDNAMM